MKSVASRILQPVATLLWSWLASTWSCACRLFHRTILPPRPCQPAWTLEFVAKQYDDEYQRNHLPCHAQLVKASWGNCCWWARIVLLKTDPDTSEPLQGRQNLRDLCRCIDFSSIPLINDTVTEIFIASKASTSKLPLVSSLPPHHRLSSTLEHLCFEAREDPSRVRYPDYIGETVTKVHLSDVKVGVQLGLAVNLATTPSGLCVLKQVNREHYMPQDSEALELELRVLEKVGGRSNIVRLAAAVVSENPYLTVPDDQSQPVLHGILLQYHPNGTLDKAKVEAGKHRRWARQLVEALALLHSYGFTHMDLKPSNIMIDEGDNLVLIDVGGAGGVTRDWLSPAMKTVPDPLKENFEARRDNDIWALGKLLVVIAELQDAEEAKEFLHQLSSMVTENAPAISLSDLITTLNCPS